jgi:hypothetical protein
MRHGTRNLNCQVMKWITISLIVLGSGCTQYSLTKEGLSTSMGLKGAILLKKYKKGTTPAFHGGNQSIIDTTVNIMVYQDISQIQFNEAQKSVRYSIKGSYDSLFHSVTDTLPLSFQNGIWYSLSCLHPKKNEPQCYVLYFTLDSKGDFLIEEYYFDGGPY